MTAPAQLPDRDEMLRRLLAVDDEPHLVERFYPLLLAKAGRRITGTGLVLALHLAVCDYTAGMPEVLARVLLMRLHQFVTALVDDETVRGEALASLAEIGLSA